MSGKPEDLDGLDVNELKKIVENPMQSDILKDGLIFAGISTIVGFAVKKLQDIAEDMD